MPARMLSKGGRPPGRIRGPAAARNVSRDGSSPFNRGAPNPLFSAVDQHIHSGTLFPLCACAYQALAVAARNQSFSNSTDKGTNSLATLRRIEKYFANTCAYTNLPHPGNWPAETPSL